MYSRRLRRRRRRPESSLANAPGTNSADLPADLATSQPQPDDVTPTLMTSRDVTDASRGLLTSCDVTRSTAPPRTTQDVVV